MKDEILAKALDSDTEIVPRYDVVLPDGTKVAENAELVLKNPVTQEGTPYNKESVLQDATAALYGLDGSATVDGVLQKVATFPSDFNSIAPDGTMVIRKITTSQNWTAPKSYSQLFKVFAVGGGGAGGGSSGGKNNGGGGGGGGYVVIEILTIPEGTIVPIVCGAGGDFVNDVTGSGEDGGITQFGSYITANGGKGGGGSNNTNDPYGGDGGAGGGGAFQGGIGGNGGKYGGGGGGRSGGGNGGEYGGGGGGGQNSPGNGGTYGGNGGNGTVSSQPGIQAYFSARDSLNNSMNETVTSSGSLYGGGGGYGSNGGTGSGADDTFGGGGGYGGNGGNGGTGAGYYGCGGGGNYGGNGGIGYYGGGGGGGLFCDGGDSNRSSPYCGGGGGGIFAGNSNGNGGDGGVYILWFKEELDK